MVRVSVPYITRSLFFVGIASLHAQAPSLQGLTAEQLANRGLVSYAAGNFPDAEAALSQFVTSFGKSAQTVQVMPRILPPLALSRVRLRKFDAALETIRLYLTTYAKGAPPETLEDLRFWEGICLAQTQQPEEARAALTAFLRDFPRSAKRIEATMLIGTLLVEEEKWKDAITYLVAIKEQVGKVERGRVVLLELFCRLETDDDDNALRLVMAEYDHSSEMIQLVAFHSLILELGDKYLEKSEHRKAIACLQRVWSRDRLLKHQNERLAALQQGLERAELTKAAPNVIYQYRQMISQIEKELKTFEKTKQFDSALRFRLAGCFLGMERYREAALILEGMLEELPPDNIVEKASLNLVQCWMQIERWPKAIESADAFQSRFPASKQLPLVLVMKGQAQQSEFLYPDSIPTLDDVITTHPTSEWAPRALFLKGFAQALLEDYPAAITTLESFGQKYPKDVLAENALYWAGMAHSMSKDYDGARQVFDRHLATFRGGALVPDATFRRAYCLHAKKDYDGAIPELRGFLEAFPKSEYRGEALSILGDALLATGEIDTGIQTFLQIPTEDVRFFEEGWFKVGKALRTQEKFLDLRTHMERFVSEHPRSSRVPEALYWVGWSHRAEGHPEKAQDVYWKAITQYGDDAGMRAIDDLFPALARLQKTEAEQKAYRAKLRDLREGGAEKQRALTMRSLWAESAFIARTDPDGSRKLLLDAAKLAKVDTDNPLLLADFADAYRESGQTEAAEQLYRDLVKWNPRAIQKDRAFAGLGLIAKAAGKEKTALEYFDRFEKETLGSSLFGEVMLAKAELLSVRGMTKEAQAALEALLAQKGARGSEKARALYEIGELHMKASQPQLAVPYFQRIYIMHGKWSEYVAKAYLRSGQAFEQLQDRSAAVKTYAEMVQREELQTFAETTAAKERLAALEPAK